jgi:glycosyltransferase involved in cell wall biosynthesis
LRRLRLVLVTETFPPEVNGVARTLGRWVEAFRSRGHSVRVIRPRQAAEGLVPGGVFGLPMPFYPQLRFGVASPSHVADLFRRANPDLVHVATEGPLGWAALVAAGWLSLPVASSFHTNYDHYLAHYGLGGLEWLLFGYLRWFHNNTAVTLVPSEATRQRLLEGGVQRVELWPRGVDSRTFHPRHRDPALRQSLGLGPGDPLFLYVGRLAPEKNLGALLTAFARLRQRQPEANRDRPRLALVGGGPLLASLQAARPAGVHLAGERHGPELARWYASADVFAFPSRSETFGNVVLEAQASGLPVVAYDLAPVNERVTSGEDGLLVPDGGDLTGALELLASQRETRERMSAAALRKAERQDWEPIFDALEQRYLALVGENRRRQQSAWERLGQGLKPSPRGRGPQTGLSRAAVPRSEDLG